MAALDAAIHAFLTECVSELCRIIILGPPGSGKSTLALHLGSLLDVPVFHLDQAFHLPGWVTVAPEVFAAEVARISELPRWVIDGNYIGSIAPRYENADAVIYLDVSRWLSMVRVVRRMITNFGRVREDAAAGCPERLDWTFLHFVWRWNQVRRSSHLAIVEGFGGRQMVLHGPRQSRWFLGLSRAELTKLLERADGGLRAASPR